MRASALILLLGVAAAAGSCGGSADSGRITSLPTVPTIVIPPPLSPVATYTLSGLAKEAWIDTGLPGAAVSIASGPAFGTAVTDQAGRYVLSNLPAGSYTVRFSKPAPYGSVTYGPITVTGDTTFNGSVSLTGTFPVTAANLQGYWVAQGPYPNQPAWILILQNGTSLEGWYKDSADYSTTMTGRYIGDAIALDVGASRITIEGRVQDARCIRAFIKNEALGGNFPVMLSRGGSCPG